MSLLTARSRRAGRRRLAIAAVAVALVPAALLTWVATSEAHTAARGDPPDAATLAVGAPPPHTVTPLLSARRLPGVVTGQLATRNVVPALAALAGALPDPSCMSVAVDGATVFDIRGTSPVLPASNMKLVTASVALAKLGPNYRFTTTVVRGPDGTLYLVGGGDPLLFTQAFLDAAQRAAVSHSGSGQLSEAPAGIHTPVEQLADRVAALVKSAPAIVGDDSRYDHERVVPSWPADYIPALEASPIGALLIDDAFSSFRPRFRLASDPTLQATTAFAGLLRARGVDVDGARTGTAPAGAAAVATIQSPPLRDIVTEMLVTSDNNTAEMLLKEIGHSAGAGTREAGLRVEMATLAAWGVPQAGVSLVDGSGLDRGDRLTCQALLAVMERAGSSGPLAAALPVAAESGTLIPYFQGNPMAGRLHAKTGTLTGSKALTGYVTAPDGHTITFAFVYNGPNERAKASELFNQFGLALATYPYKPNLAAYAPVPARRGP